MKIVDAYRHAIFAGGNAVSFAMGMAEAVLRDNPDDVKALMYKGGLLTLLGSDVAESQKRRTYQRTGVCLMQRALQASAADIASQTELHFVYATTLAMLPRSFGLDTQALDVLRELVERRDFVKLEKLEFVRSMTLLACLAEHFGHLEEAKDRFGIARNADQDLAIETYDTWLNRE